MATTNYYNVAKRAVSLPDSSDLRRMTTIDQLQSDDKFNKFIKYHNNKGYLNSDQQVVFDGSPQFVLFNCIDPKILIYRHLGQATEHRHLSGLISRFPANISDASDNQQNINTTLETFSMAPYLLVASHTQCKAIGAYLSEKGVPQWLKQFLDPLYHHMMEQYPDFTFEQRYAHITQMAAMQSACHLAGYPAMVNSVQQLIPTIYDLTSQKYLFAQMNFEEMTFYFSLPEVTAEPDKEPHNTWSW